MAKAKAKVIKEFCGLSVGELMEVDPIGYLVNKGYVKLIKEKKQGVKKTKIDPKAE